MMHPSFIVATGEQSGVSISFVSSTRSISISSSLRKGSLRCLVCRCDGLFSLVNVACHANICDVHCN